MNAIRRFVEMTKKKQDALIASSAARQCWLAYTSRNRRFVTFTRPSAIRLYMNMNEE